MDLSCIYLAVTTTILNVEPEKNEAGIKQQPTFYSYSYLEYLRLHLTVLQSQQQVRAKYDSTCDGSQAGICVKYFLSFPQKNLSPEKTETN